MTVIKHRSVLLGLALAALLVSTLAATGPPAAAATATGTDCGLPVFFGLHGMAEGPSDSNPTGNPTGNSPEIDDFGKALNLITGPTRPVYEIPVPYTTVYASKWDALTAVNAGPLTDAVKDGEKRLQHDVDDWTAGCQLSQDRIALVGYSMGAWVINKWLKDNPGEWIKISAVVLYGDPCWNQGADQGLARYTLPPLHLTMTRGCSPAANYPYPAPDTTTLVNFTTASVCLQWDPICGGGYANNKGLQLKVAENCKPDSGCTHLDYTFGAPSGGVIYDGAKFVVQHLLG